MRTPARERFTDLSKSAFFSASQIVCVDVDNGRDFSETS